MEGVGDGDSELVGTPVGESDRLFSVLLDTDEVDSVDGEKLDDTETVGDSETLLLAEVVKEMDRDCVAGLEGEDVALSVDDIVFDELSDTEPDRNCVKDRVMVAVGDSGIVSETVASFDTEMDDESEVLDDMLAFLVALGVTESVKDGDTDMDRSCVGVSDTVEVTS